MMRRTIETESRSFGMCTYDPETEYVKTIIDYFQYETFVFNLEILLIMVPCCIYEVLFILVTVVQ